VIYKLAFTNSYRKSVRRQSRLGSQTSRETFSASPTITRFYSRRNQPESLGEIYFSSFYYLPVYLKVFPSDKAYCQTVKHQMQSWPKTNMAELGYFAGKKVYLPL
jgi:hypothetical protein